MQKLKKTRRKRFLFKKKEEKNIKKHIYIYIYIYKQINSMKNI